MDPSKSGFGANQEGSKINQLPINYEMLHKKKCKSAIVLCLGECTIYTSIEYHWWLKGIWNSAIVLFLGVCIIYTSAPHLFRPWISFFWTLGSWVGSLQASMEHLGSPRERGQWAWNIIHSTMSYLIPPSRILTSFSCLARVSKWATHDLSISSYPMLHTVDCRTPATAKADTIRLARFENLLRDEQVGMPPSCWT